jgi:hypothetical protein
MSITPSETKQESNELYTLLPTVLDYAKEKLAITQKMMDEDDHKSNMHIEFLNGTYNAYDDIIFAIENNVVKAL